MSAIQFSYEPTSLPSRFDARQVKDCKSEFQHFWRAQISVNEYTHQHLLSLSQEWPGLISPVEDQGWCSSSWAVATAAVAGDRYASSLGYHCLVITIIITAILIIIITAAVAEDRYRPGLI